MGDVDITMVGSATLEKFAADLKKAGTKDLRKQLYAGLSRATKPMRAAVQESARERLPKSGGLASRKTRLKKTGVKVIDGKEYVTRSRVKSKGRKENVSLAERVAGARFNTTAKRGTAVGVTFKATAAGGKKVDLKALESGHVRKPLFGNREHWYEQRVNAAFFSDPVQREAPGAREELIKAVDAVARQVTP